MRAFLASVLYFSLGVFPWLAPSEDRSKPPDPQHFSILGLTIGADNIETLQTKLGPVKKCHTRENVSVAGYANSKEVLIFEFGEVGGGDVTAFYLGPPSQKVSCPLSQLSSQNSELVTKGGVHLGMTVDDFVHIFGPPMSRGNKGQWNYDWTREAKYTEKDRKTAAAAGYEVSGDTYLVGITVKAQFKSGVLQYFYISKLETT